MSKHISKPNFKSTTKTDFGPMTYLTPVPYRRQILGSRTPSPSQPTGPRCEEYSNQNASYQTPTLKLTTTTRSYAHIPFTTTIANHSLATLSRTGSRRKFYKVSRKNRSFRAATVSLSRKRRERLSLTKILWESITKSPLSSLIDWF